MQKTPCTMLALCYLAEQLYYTPFRLVLAGLNSCCKRGRISLDLVFRQLQKLRKAAERFLFLGRSRSAGIAALFQAESDTTRGKKIRRDRNFCSGRSTSVLATLRICVQDERFFRPARSRSAGIAALFQAESDTAAYDSKQIFRHFRTLSPIPLTSMPHIRRAR